MCINSSYIPIPSSFLSFSVIVQASLGHRRSTTGLFFFFFFSFFFFFFCIFTRLETLTICSCNYFTFKTFSINPQSTLVYGLLYRQGRKRGVLVLLGSWDSPHLKLILHLLPLFQCWLSTHGCLCKRSRPLPSFKISTTARKN